MLRSARGEINCSRRYRVAAASVGYEARARTLRFSLYTNGRDRSDQTLLFFDTPIHVQVTRNANSHQIKITICDCHATRGQIWVSEKGKNLFGRGLVSHSVKTLKDDTDTLVF